MADFLNCIRIPEGGAPAAGQSALQAALLPEEAYLYPLALLLLLLPVLWGLALLCHRAFSRRQLLQQKAAMDGRNHPAIPAIVYPTPALPQPGGAGKQAAKTVPQQEAPQAQAPVPEKDAEAFPEDYAFFALLDSPEDD